uniref:Uncharacterized protein n=1 Tax=Timema poppense TaxID=170557 RepID=A0A7R9H5X1_TIMPO|nr:unnamed protein product [Timema poppensis]
MNCSSRTPEACLEFSDLVLSLLLPKNIFQNDGHVQYPLCLESHIHRKLVCKRRNEQRFLINQEITSSDRKTETRSFACSISIMAML